VFAAFRFLRQPSRPNPTTGLENSSVVKIDETRSIFCIVAKPALKSLFPKNNTVDTT